jgi:hypothetical protein
MNKYVPGSIPGVDPATANMIRDLYQRTNSLQDRLDGMKVELPPMGAKKERPVPGVLQLPSPAGDGFIRVNEDGVIASYQAPVRSTFCQPIFLSSTEAAITAAVETNLRQILIPAGSHKRNEHLVIEFGGFCLSQGGVPALTSQSFFIRYGNTGVASPAALQMTFASGGDLVTTWFAQLVITHDLSPGGGPDYSGIGGIAHISATPPSFQIARGEIAVDFTVDNYIYFNGIVVGTGVTNSMVNETFEIIKYSTNI